MTAPPREPQNLYDALSTIYDWLCDDRLTQWPYMENGPFYSDLPKYQEVARAALAAAPAPSAEPKRKRCEHDRWPGDDCDICPAPAEPPAQAATERMGTHWETCATDGGPRHYDCALRLIEQQAREIAELRADKDAYHYERAERAERAEAKREALRECVRAADAMRDMLYKPRGDVPSIEAYDAARAKGKS